MEPIFHLNHANGFVPDQVHVTNVLRMHTANLANSLTQMTVRWYQTYSMTDSPGRLYRYRIEMRKASRSDSKHRRRRHRWLRVAHSHMKITRSNRAQKMKPKSQKYAHTPNRWRTVFVELKYHQLFVTVHLIFINMARTYTMQTTINFRNSKMIQDKKKTNTFVCGVVLTCLHLIFRKHDNRLNGLQWLKRS